MLKKLCKAFINSYLEGIRCVFFKPKKTHRITHLFNDIFCLFMTSLKIKKPLNH